MYRRPNAAGVSPRAAAVRPSSRVPRPAALTGRAGLAATIMALALAVPDKSQPGFERRGPGATPVVRGHATAQRPRRDLAELPTPPAVRDWRYWPFSDTSPWNHPIGKLARYADIDGLGKLAAGINYDDRWTASIAIATRNDPVVPVSFYGGDLWKFLAGGGSVCRNPADDELMLRESSTPEVLFPGNFYSTISSPDSSVWILPPDYKPAATSYWRTAYLPPGSCASPDTDGLMAVFQPNGWVLDLYEGIVLSDNSIIAAMASYVDARGDGTGWWNGRRASMLPSFAGLIRKGEIASGLIPHALAAVLSPTMLKQEAVWPAYAFDRHSGYSGTLPMGALLAIPPQVNLDALGLSREGKVIARAAQNYGVYIVDRGGEGGMTFLAELGNREIRWEGSSRTLASWQELLIIKNQLKHVTNNSAETPGGGGELLAPPAPPFGIQPAGR